MSGSEREQVLKTIEHFRHFAEEDDYIITLYEKLFSKISVHPPKKSLEPLRLLGPCAGVFQILNIAPNRTDRHCAWLSQRDAPYGCEQKESPAPCSDVGLEVVRSRYREFLLTWNG